jgi:predicted kinase
MKSLRLTKPHLLMLVGIPGSGKSFFAEKFADTFGAPYVAHEKIARYIPEQTKEVGEIARYQIEELLKTSHSLLVEGGTTTRAGRVELARVARSKGYEPLIIWVQTDQATAQARATKPSSDRAPLSAEDYARALKRFTPPAITEKTIVISGKHTYASQAKVVLKKLSAPRAEISAHTTPPVRPAQPGRRNITIR